MAIRRGCLYVMGNREHGFYKIGFSRSDPRNRMRDIQAACPLELKLVVYIYVKHAAEMEKQAHDHFKARRLVLGGRLTEWFQLTWEELQEVYEVVPLEERLFGQHLEQDYRKGAGELYRPASSYRRDEDPPGPLLKGLLVS